MFDKYNGNNNNNENVISYIDACHNITRAQKLNSDKSDTIILDSASTVDVIGDKTILRDIHNTLSPSKVKTIGGYTVIRKQSYMGYYPRPVWYHPARGVNILSLNTVQKYCRCTMNREKGNSISIHLNDGKTVNFKASRYGLCQYTAKDNQSINNIWTMMVYVSEDISFSCFNIDTVSRRADKYTKWQIKSARSARDMENIVM